MVPVGPVNGVGGSGGGSGSELNSGNLMKVCMSCHNIVMLTSVIPWSLKKTMKESRYYVNFRYESLRALSLRVGTLTERGDRMAAGSD